MAALTRWVTMRQRRKKAAGACAGQRRHATPAWLGAARCCDDMDSSTLSATHAAICLACSQVLLVTHDGQRLLRRDPYAHQTDYDSEVCGEGVGEVWRTRCGSCSGFQSARGADAWSSLAPLVITCWLCWATCNSCSSQVLSFRSPTRLQYCG